VHNFFTRIETGGQSEAIHEYYRRTLGGGKILFDMEEFDKFLKETNNIK
jgi:hypothetical protein